MNIYDEKLENKNKLSEDVLEDSTSNEVVSNKADDGGYLIEGSEEPVVELVVNDIKKENSPEDKSGLNDVVTINNLKSKKKNKTVEYIEDGDYSNKAWSITLILCILLGFIGLHRFYVGKAGTAIIMLLTFGGFGIWVLVDLIRIIINNFTDEEGKVIKRNSFAS